MDTAVMTLVVPSELIDYFGTEAFEHYPLVSIPQKFNDERGQIINVADGTIGDVALISSKKGAIRANHFHLNDWHLCFLIDGEMEYHWEEDGAKNRGVLQVGPGELIFTPPRTPHRIDFKTDSLFLSISKLSRTTENYESDTRRLDSSYFH